MFILLRRKKGAVRQEAGSGHGVMCGMVEERGDERRGTCAVSLLRLPIGGSGVVWPSVVGGVPVALQPRR